VPGAKLRSLGTLLRTRGGVVLSASGVGVPITSQIRLLSRTVTDLDSATVSRIITTMLRIDGVVATWSEVLALVLRQRGEVFDRTANGICAEHLFSECIRAALSAVLWRRRGWNRCRPVLPESSPAEWCAAGPGR